MNCPACTRAQTDGWCSDYRKLCPDCAVRQLACSPKNRREAAYDQIQKQFGSDARKAVMERVRLEWARVAALRNPKPA